MKHALPLSLTISAVLALGSCGDDNSPHALAKANIAAMQDFSATLAKITDKASAVKHTDALMKLSKRIDDLGQRMQKAGTPSESEGEKMQKELGPAMEAAMGQLTKEMMRIGGDPELQEVLGPVLEKMDL